MSSRSNELFGVPTLSSRSSSLLTLSRGQSLHPETPFTPAQARADALVSSFVDHATDGYSLAAMVGGGLVYRLGRIGTLALFSSRLTPYASPLTSHVLRLTSIGVGFTGEVFAFETGQRALRVGIGGADPSLLRFSGENGLGRGLVGAAITLGPLKGAGVFAQGQNPVIQHLFQDSAMVLAHNVLDFSGTSARTRHVSGTSPAPESLAEQFLNAEATLWQMNAGMALVRGAFPTIGQMDRGLDLSIRSRIAPSPALRAPSPTRGEGYNDGELLQPLLVTAGNGARAVRPSQGIADTIFAMTGTKEGEGPRVGIRESIRAESPPQSAALPSHILEIQRELHERNYYNTQLLRFSLERILSAIQGGDFRRLEDPLLRDWLIESQNVQAHENTQLIELRNELATAMRSRDISEETEKNTRQVYEQRYSRILHVRQQLQRVLQLASRPLDTPSLADLRRRLDWVLQHPEFSREFHWNKTAVAPRFQPLVTASTDMHETGRRLLTELHPNLRSEDRELYDRAALGPIRNRDIAFDLDKTLGDTLNWYIADTQLRSDPERYDISYDHFVYQNARMRIPYRGMQALLLGLWAAGNRVRLYTASANIPFNHEIFFNDFPLLKVAFGLVPPTDPFRILSPEDLHRAPYFMDALKRTQFHQRFLESPAGEQMIRDFEAEEGMRRPSYLKDTKIPFPDFPFDVLVDDLYYFVGEMQTLGFGRRWVLAPGNAEGTLKALESYFAQALPENLPRIGRWWASYKARDQTMINPSTPSRNTQATHPFGISTELLQAVRNAQNVVVLAGAGMSAESGIPTFRDIGSGLWSNFRMEEVATPEAFATNPGRVWTWHESMKRQFADVRPNPGHFALAALEKRLPHFTLVTQNIDGLHQAAGSRNVLEIHGNILRVRCSEEGRVVERWDETGEVPPRCPHCSAPLRHDVVWFGELLPQQTLQAAMEAAEKADLFISIGTSALVYPAAALPRTALRAGRSVIEINPEETALSRQAKFVLRGSSGQVLPALLRGLGEEPR